MLSCQKASSVRDAQKLLAGLGGDARFRNVPAALDAFLDESQSPLAGLPPIGGRFRRNLPSSLDPCTFTFPVCSS
jgi:hypothetical protein